MAEFSWTCLKDCLGVVRGADEGILNGGLEILPVLPTPI